MIKVKLRELEKEPNQHLLLQDEYIPFSVRIGNANILPDTLYARNISGENFIEFRFDRNTKQLYEITMVALQPSIVSVAYSNTLDGVKKPFFCCMIENESDVDISKPIEIQRSTDALSLRWDQKFLNYFFISANCILGINEDHFLSAVILCPLSGGQIEEIVGL